MKDEQWRNTAESKLPEGKKEQIWTFLTSTPLLLLETGAVSGGVRAEKNPESTYLFGASSKIPKTQLKQSFLLCLESLYICSILKY